MKKLFLFLLTCCLGQTGMLRAADTDISSMTNVIYIESFSAKPGSSELDVSFKMKNTAAIRGFQFNLTLPEGVTPATYGSGNIKCTLAAARLGEGDQHTINVELQGDGSYRFLCGSAAIETFTGTEGEVAVLKVNIATDMAEGAYPIVLTAMKLSETDISKFYETERVEATLTIDKSLRTVLDETSATAPEAATGVNVLVKRTIKANEWSTICLPFAMTAEQVTAAFGTGVKIGDFKGCDVDDETGDVKVKFDEVTAIEANHPYIIKVKTDVAEFTAGGVDIAPASAEVKMDKKGRKYNSFIGNYENGTVLEDGFLFLSGNNFNFSNGKTKIKAFRGYFVFDAADVYYESRLAISFADEATGIAETVRTRSGENDILYSLGGQRVSKPAKGIYVRDGKKVIIK